MKLFWVRFIALLRVVAWGEMTEWGILTDAPPPAERGEASVLARSTG